MKDPLFFIALLPDADIQKEVTVFKQYAAENFDSRHALKSPPHLTLQPPFRWSLKKLKRLKTNLDNFARTQSPFSVTLHNWDHFSDRVIFIDVEDNPDLSHLKRKLSTLLESELELKNDNPPYHFHMTVAFKDLKKTMFPKAWAHFSRIEFTRHFRATQITLLKHNGQRWERFEDYKLER